MDLKSLMPFGRRDVAAGEDPFTAMRREMDRLFDEMSRGFGLPRGVWGGEGGAGLRLDVKETDKAVEVHAELPGVDEKDVQLELADNVLTIKGEKKQDKQEQDKGYYLVERAYGSFMRRVPLPVEVDEDKVEARFKNGVLTVILPKSPTVEAKTRKIEIKSA
jgi:HSP20 family protein